MTVEHPFRFAVVANGTEGPEWTALAQRVEALGYDALLVTDHVTDRVAAVPALAVAAAHTDRIGVGTFVLNNDLRHPVLLAKDFAALDALSGGRALLGLGAGWMSSDYEVTGVPRERGAVRLARLRQSVGIVRSLLAGAAVDVDGPHYRVRADAGLIAHDGPGPRLLLGGGRRGALEFAAREADIVSVVPPLGPQGPRDVTDLAPQRVDEQVGWVRAASAGRREAPRMNHVVWECFVTARPAPIVAALATAFGTTPDLVAQSPSFLVGSVDSVVDALWSRRERWGFSFVTVPVAALDAFAPVVARLTGR
ncbi:probable F420-dependent oxidoreductase, MSMEG_2516 family [Micromonospora nigra]|uniref:Probable F420-dependent oxidoreductase, MSMEG_2516 family n=1 Tax=Micromonospora nigra TaxID=145857 RepID=A0A1C6RBW1_9ACTN|nr:TIGR03621 family F420-dependent LLM class oxidoreductase [Micromonospora nigra]SCL14623.1 probable F420-dependent oxidoreductase, MSMEG_2516 family [Micromonospora nigra]